jgi:PAS domain S-box-containing protein
VTLRIQRLPDLDLRHGVASTFEAAGAAELIRREIGNMFRDGTLAALIAKYTYYGLEDGWASYDLMQSAERRRWVSWGVSALGVALGLILWLAGTLRGRRRREALLRESEERFRSVADTAPVMIWVSGPDKLCTFFNKPWLSFTGRTMGQESGNGWAEGVHPADLQRCIAIFHSSFDARSAFRMEYRLRRADGEYRWLLDNGTPLYSEGEFAGFIGSCIDITEQKRIEEQLRASEVRLIEAQRLAKIGSWELDIEAERLRWSDEIPRIFGLTHGAPAIASTLLDCVHPKDLEMILEADRQLRATTAPVNLEYRIIRPDGEVRFVHSIAAAIRNDQGTTVRIAGATQDITEQVKARELLRESEERLKNAERLAHVGHWDWDIKANHLWWSEEMFSIFGQPEDYAPSYDGLLEEVVPGDRERLALSIKASLADNYGRAIEFQIGRPDGAVRTVNCISEVLLDEEGTPSRMFGACQDITDLRQAQEESFARQKLESVGTLASGIAHDFNNLLGGVLAHVDVALAESNGSPPPQTELKAIRDVAIRGSEIVRQLMIYAGKESEAYGLVDVSQIVGEMIELLKVSVSKHAVVETDLGRNLPAVRANAAQLRQIVMNLVMNASDAIGDRDGVVRVTTRRTTVGRDAMIWKGVAEGDYLQVEVSDTGHGMTPETQARMFDPFFTTRSAGHGLGLAVVHGIVRSLRGSINVASEPGKGTTFEVLLPCAAPALEAGGPLRRAEEPARELQPCSVLVVEDEDALRGPVTKMLRKAGFVVFEASDGSSAIEVLRANGGKVDVILLDLTIPGPTSREVVAQAVQARPDAKVVLTSAYSEETARGAVSAEQVRGFIRKPFQLAELVRTLRNVASQ